jgi:uncharacterized protein (TIGR00369 family)
MAQILAQVAALAIRSPARHVDGMSLDRLRSAGLPPIARTLGLELESLELGACTLFMEVQERHHNAVGTLHGGVFCDIADLAMGFAYGSQVQDGESFTTIELKINYMKPIIRGRLRAVAKVVKAGKTIGLIECDVLDEKGSLLARSSSTCMTLRGEKAAGRALLTPR